MSESTKNPESAKMSKSTKTPDFCEKNPEFLKICEKIRPGDIKIMYDFTDKDSIGGSANVLKATDVKTSNTVAIKVIKKAALDQEELVTFVVNEITNLSTLSHKRVVEFHRALHDDKNIYIVCEFLEKRSLWVMTNFFEFSVPEAAAVRLMTDVLEGLAYLHAQNVAHLDINPGNIMLDANDCVKLIDFGASVKLPSVSEPICENYSGTIQFKAPEVIRFKTFRAEKADIYSVGATLHSMIAGKADWATRQVLPPDAKWEWVGPTLKAAPEMNKLIQWLTHSDPTKRPTAQEALAKINTVRAQLTIRAYIPTFGSFLGLI